MNKSRGDEAEIRALADRVRATVARIGVEESEKVMRLSRDQVARITHGISSPSALALARLAAASDTDANWLLTGTAPRSRRIDWTTAKDIQLLGARIRLCTATMRRSDAAAAAGVTVQQLGRLEKGQHWPTVKVIVAIAEATGVDVQWLLTGHAVSGGFR